MYLFPVKCFIVSQSFETVELLLQRFNFEPSDTQTQVGALALQADVVVGVRSTQADLRASYYQPRYGERWRAIALPGPSVENLHSFYAAFHADEPPPDVIFDCHTTAQYLAGYAPDHRQIDLRHYEAAEVRPGEQQAGGLYMLGSDIWPRSHSVLGTNNPSFTLSTLGRNSLLAYDHIARIMVAYRATYLQQLTPRIIE